MTAARILWTPALVAAAGIVLSGCQTQPKSLYHWGNYQPAVYSHFKGESVEAQRMQLEQTAQQAQSLGERLPPGFNAHLGLLYLNTGQLDRARGAFEAEATLFPESRPYMSFLLNNLARQSAGSAR
jgi:hypothetical protein